MRHAFTLIELLVVFTIIAVLMAFLMPLATMARYQAGKVVCLSNLRQIGVGFSAYQSDNSQYIPSPCGGRFWGKYADWGYPTWDRMLVPYLGSNDGYDPYAVAAATPTATNVRVKVYRCGLDRALECDSGGTPMARGIQRRSYQMNFGARDARFNLGKPFRPSQLVPSYPQTPTGDLVLLGDRSNESASFDNTLGWVGGTYDAPWGWGLLPGQHAHPRGESNLLFMDLRCQSFRDYARWDSISWYTVNGDFTL